MFGSTVIASAHCARELATRRSLGAAAIPRRTGSAASLQQVLRNHGSRASRGEVLRTVLFFPYKPSSYGGTFNIAARIARIVWMPAASACTRMQERILAFTAISDLQVGSCWLSVRCPRAAGCARRRALRWKERKSDDMVQRNTSGSNKKTLCL